MSAPSPHANGAGDLCAGMSAVLLAGGRGTRLAPYTTVLPKPLMPVGEKAVLEILVDQLRGVGITDFVFCVGHLAHLIRTLFDSQPRDDVTIDYLHENEPLGTAGPLRRLPRPAQTFLVMNGDVLTTLDFRDLVSHHRERGNLLTIACKARPVQIEYGILSVARSGRNRGRVVGYQEKPRFDLTVSMGIYVLEPEVLDYVPEGYFDFPDLVVRLLDERLPVGGYLYDGLWFDIGRREDYEEAVAAWAPAPPATSAAVPSTPTNGIDLNAQLLESGRTIWRRRVGAGRRSVRGGR